jgi:hypothetical protein
VTTPEAGPAARTYGIEDIESAAADAHGADTHIRPRHRRDGTKVMLIAGSSGVVDLADSYFAMATATGNRDRGQTGEQRPSRCWPAGARR